VTTAEDTVNDGRRGQRRFAACALPLLVALATVSGASASAHEHAKLSSAERAFAKAYTALVPSLNRASDAIVHAVRNAGKDTDAQIVTVFTGLAKQWTKATRPLLALTAPPAEAGLFAEVTRYVPALETDLLATAQAGRTHNANAGTQAGRHIARDFNALAAAVKVLKRKLGLR
jgi:hypothetical protein